MYLTLLKFLAVTFVFSLTSCNAGSSQSSDEIKSPVKKVIEPKVLSNKSPKDIALQEKLQGIWQSNHEPVAIQLFEDGSYRRFVPGGYTEPEAPEEEFDSGLWSVENAKLSLISESGQKENIVLSWVEDELLYFGDIEEDYDPEYGSMKEFAEELGFSKTKE